MQDVFHTNVIRNNYDELLRLRGAFLSKHKKYSKALSKLLVLNTGSNVLSTFTGVGAIATGATVIGIPVTLGLGGVAVAGAVASAIITALIKRYQTKILNN